MCGAEATAPDLRIEAYPRNFRSLRRVRAKLSSKYPFHFVVLAELTSFDVFSLKVTQNDAHNPI